MKNILWDNKQNIFFIDDDDSKKLIFGVETLNFCGKYEFIVENCILENYIKSLSNLYETLSGTFELNDMDSDSYIIFSLSNNGILTIHGQLGCSVTENFLVFNIKCDQTVLKKVICIFKKII